MAGGAALLFFSCSGALAGTKMLPAAFQARILELYSQDRCDLVRAMVKPEQYAGLRPNIQAVTAYCLPPGPGAEKLFQQAEASDPTGDLIYLLHAKSRWKVDPKGSEPLWRKVLMLARNPFMKRMANEYLAGRIEEDHPISLSPYTFSGEVTAGGVHETDPRNPDFIYQRAKPSSGLLGAATASLQRWVPWGSLGATYSLGSTSYFSAHEWDLMSHDLDLRAAVRVGPAEDIVARVVGGYSTLGGASYRMIYGFGALGTISRPSYKQYVQGLIFRERLIPAAVTPLAGNHFRFEYAWEFYPPDWLIRFLGSLEHVSASNDAIATGITNSHTDVGLNFRFERDFKLFLLGLQPRLVARNDADVSTFTAPGQGQPTTRRRADYLVALKPVLTIPLVPYVHLLAWYEWTRIFSNIGPSDYGDRNYQNQTVALALKAYVSSY